MTIRTVLATSAAYLALHTLTVFAKDVDPHSGSAWISFAETPVRSTEQQELHARATENTDPKLLKIISAHVSRSTDLRFTLESYSDAKLEFRTDTFLVTRIEGMSVDLAAGEDFSKSVMHKLAIQLRNLGYHVESCNPETLLHRNDNQGPDEPEFVVPFMRMTRQE